MNEHLSDVPMDIRRRSPRRRGMWMLVPLVAGFLILFVFSQRWKDSLRIERLVVEGARIIPAQEIFQAAGVAPRSPMYGIDVFEVREQVMKYPFFKSVTVNRKYPNALCIQVVEREPVACINTGQVWYVDVEGVVLPHIQSPVKFDLPMISGIDGNQLAKEGQLLQNKDVFEAIQILQNAQAVDTALYHLISEVNMNKGGDIVLYSSDAGAPILLGRGDFLKKLMMLQTFWKNFVKAADAENLRYVDLRFNDQVVVKWDQSGESQPVKLTM